MTKREIIKLVLDGGRPPYVPWSFKFTEEPKKMLQDYYRVTDLDIPLGNHILNLGDDYGFFDLVGPDLWRDVFGVVWDKSIDKDIGNIKGCVLPEPTLTGYQFPDPHDPRIFKCMDSELSAKPDLFRVFQLGFSLYERAWTLRGIENLLMDFYLHPAFVHQLFDAIYDYNIAQIDKALEWDIDAIYFGDDWGQQKGLIMGPSLWREFIKPRIARMYGAVKSKGKFVIQHSCGDVSAIFPDLIEIGLDCYQTFQPEIYDIRAVKKEFGQDLSFWGGISTQRLLPFATPGEVKDKTIEIMRIMGAGGGYIAAPTHSIPGDVPPENVEAMLDVFQNQEKYL